MGRIGIKCDFYQVSKIIIIPFLVLASYSSQAAELIDRIVADVNGRPVTYSEVQEKVRKGVSVEISAYPVSSSKDPYELALHDRINLELILQRAEELDVSISDESLELEISKFMKRRNLTRAALKAALSQEGLSYEQYKSDWRRQMIISQFQAREILPSIKISDKDLETFYLQQEGALGESLRVFLRQIKVGSEKHRVIDKVQTELKAGMSFSKAAMLYSEDSSTKSVGGLMPSLLLKDLAPVFRKPISSLDTKQFTAPIEVSGSVYFFYLVRKEFAESDDFARAKASIRQKLRQESIVTKTMDWIIKERARSDIRIIE